MPLPFFATTPAVRSALIAVFAFVMAAALFWANTRPKRYILRVTAGDKLGRRYEIAQVLAAEAAKRGVAMPISDSTGSADALQKVSDGTLDCALIQGGIGTAPHVREVAVLAQEPLHLLVKHESADAVNTQGLRALRGKTINLSTKGSGTRRVALTALEFADMKTGRDYTDEYVSYEQLETRSYRYLPDALFSVSLIPSPVVEFLVRKHGYRVVPVRFARALSLRHPTLHEISIPPFAYGMVPVPTPPETVTTVGTQLLLIARDDVPEAAVKTLLMAVFDGDFARGRGADRPIGSAVSGRAGDAPASRRDCLPRPRRSGGDKRLRAGLGRWQIADSVRAGIRLLRVPMVSATSVPWLRYVFKPGDADGARSHCAGNRGDSRPARTDGVAARTGRTENRGTGEICPWRTARRGTDDGILGRTPPMCAATCPP